MTHCEARLADRNISIEAWKLAKIAAYFGNTPTAVLLARLSEHKGTNSGDYKTRAESNGELVVLIVRDGRPITVMYRRENQPFTPEALHVRQCIELTQ